MELTYRPRRLRRTPALRAMVREHSLSAADFIYPLFVHEGAEVEPIGAMPGASRWSLAALTGEVQRAYDLGVRCIYIACCFSMFSGIERFALAYWPWRSWR